MSFINGRDTMLISILVYIVFFILKCICDTPGPVCNPLSIFTLQCRKYKKSNKIMKKSEHIYNKFKSMFLIGDGENFAAVSLFDMINVDTFNFVPGQTVCSVCRTYAGI